MTAQLPDMLVAQTLLRAQLILLGRILQSLESEAATDVRSLISDLSSAGLSQAEIGRVLGKDQSTVSRALGAGRAARTGRGTRVVDGSP
jgi:hypothetical protein